METRARDLARAEQLRRARTDLVLASPESSLGQILSVTGDAALTYVVKVLDVAPGLGKVAGRRAMASIGLDQFVRIVDLTGAQRDALVEAARG